MNWMILPGCSRKRPGRPKPARATAVFLRVMSLLLLLPPLIAQTSRADPPLRDLFGASVALVGDIDGRGQPDLAIGDPVWNDSGREHGRVWIVSTESGRALSVIMPESAGRSFGWTLCALGDVDGGGKADLAVGEMRWRAWPGGSEPRATVSIVSLSRLNA